MPISYIQYQLEDGADVREFYFKTTEEQDNAIRNAIENHEDCGAGECTACTSDVLNAGGAPFTDVNNWLPASLGRTLSNLPGVQVFTPVLPKKSLPPE